MAMTPLAYDIADAGVELGNVGRTTIYELIRSGELKACKVRRRTVVPRSSIEEYLQRQLQGEQHADNAA